MLKLLLDEHISPRVVIRLNRRYRAIEIRSMVDWENGRFLGQDDHDCLREAAAQKLTLVTYDRRTIPPLLKNWAEEGRSHGGVIFVDEKAISPAAIGALVRALAELVKATRTCDWTNRIYFLRR
jgi:hypothetical protein